MWGGTPIKTETAFGDKVASGLPSILSLGGCDLLLKLAFQLLYRLKAESHNWAASPAATQIDPGDLTNLSFSVDCAEAGLPSSC
jgi:hypothetical protein